MAQSDLSKPLETTDLGVKVTIVINAIIITILSFAIIWAFNSFLTYNLRTENLIRLIVKIGAPLLWIASSWQLFTAQQKVSYILDQNSLIVSKKKFMGTQDTMHRYDTMLTVEAHRSKIFSIGNYGSIVIKILHEDQPIVLRNVVDPVTCAKDIKRRISTDKQIAVGTHKVTHHTT